MTKATQLVSERDLNSDTFGLNPKIVATMSYLLIRYL